MSTDLDFFKNKILNSSLEDSVTDIEELIIISNQISDIFLECLERRNERFVISEKLSRHFFSYVEKLNTFLDSSDSDLNFWAATLIMNYNLNNVRAEQILLDIISYGPLEKATIATTILFRIKNTKVSGAITTRLKDHSINEEMKEFFSEKLDGINS